MNRFLPYLVAVLTAAPAAAADPAYPPLPKGVSSLGAVACDGYVYVYGGHAGKTHSYDTATVLGAFHRLKLDGGTKWEELPGGPRLQGVNLAAHGGKVYRVGGMTPKNAPGEPSDTHSLADAAVYDPAAGKWQPLPPLPAPRSSHDVLTVGDKLVVVGGWALAGKDGKPTWHDTALTLDLAAKAAKWEAIPQPFKRRALTAAAVGSKVYVIAGLGSDGAHRTVDILDTDTNKWTRGPDLPGEDTVGFSPAAATVGGRVVVNTSAGPLHRLSADGSRWDEVGAVAVKRMVARLVPAGPSAVLVVGGASRGKGNMAELELIKLPEPPAAGG